MEVSHAALELGPNMNWIKTSVLNHDPDSPVILHRKEILGRKGIFTCLNDLERCVLFDRAIIRLMETTNYTVITAFIDKRAMLNKSNWKNKQPYVYLMDILVEKYSQFLERKKDIGDIMPEARGSKKDSALQAAFERTRNNGTYFVSNKRIESAIRSSHLKFRSKRENIAGLQLCDLLAHPSHMNTRKLIGHAVNLGSFCLKVSDIMTKSKYDRSAGGRIMGYGIKIAS